MRIELIYFRGCPHVEEARANIRWAVDRERVEATIDEWDRDDAATPDYARAYASPTVLVDGHDVDGVGGPGHGASCRTAGAPSIERIRRALSSS